MNPLMKLYARNRSKGVFRAESSGEGEPDTIFLYDMIVDTDEEAEWWGGVSPERFMRTLSAMKAPEIHLRVYSPGGSVFAARSMEQAIREHPSRIIAHNDGLVASAASYLILPADEIIAAPGSFTMIHKAWTIAWGNETDLEKTAALLRDIDGTLVQSYAARTKQDPEEIAAWMAAETWMNADRAVELGFADRVATSAEPDRESDEAQASARPPAWDLSAYDHAPRIERPSSPPAAQQPDRAKLRRAALARMIPA